MFLQGGEVAGCSHVQPGNMVPDDFALVVEKNTIRVP